MKIRAHIQLLSTAEGGRMNPVYSNYRPTLRLGTDKQSDCLITVLDKPSINPGESGEVNITIAHPNNVAGIKVNSEFKLTEGFKEIAKGKVTEVVTFNFSVGDIVLFNNQEAEIIEFTSVFNVNKARIKILKSNELKEVIVDQLQESLNVYSDSKISYLAIAAKIKSEIANQAILAPLESNIVPLPHQILALEKVMSGQFLRFLMADEVGMGKTIETGLVLKELKLRGIVKRTLIITPLSAMGQWKSEMKKHFNETFHIYETGTINSFVKVFSGFESDNEINIWSQHNQVIVSMDSLKPLESRRGWSNKDVEEYNKYRIQSVLQAEFDLLVIDECHKVGGSSQTVGRYQMADILCNAIPNVLLLSATPHRGKSDHFRRILQLLDADAFSGEGMPAIPELEPYVVRTEKRQAIDYNGKPLFNKRNTARIEVEYDPLKHFKQKALYENVTAYVVEGFNLAKDNKNTSYQFVMILFQRMMSSSTQAILDAMQKRAERLSGEKKDYNRDKALMQLEEYGEESQMAMDFEQRIYDAIEEAQINYDTELTTLQNLIKEAQDCLINETDAKIDYLLERLSELKKKEHNPDLKFLIFTEFTSTQKMLAKILQDRGGYICDAINGSMSFDERVEALKNFKEKAQILIATDAAGESLNMQFAHIVINYDMPWNPMVVEQRIGRVDRIGQAHEVLALNLMLDNSVDKRVFEVIETKLNQIMVELGINKTADVLDSTIEQKKLDQLYLTSLLDPARFEQESKNWLEEIKQKLREYKSTEGALPTVNTKEIKVEKVDAIKHSPIPNWLEGMTKNYLRAKGILYQPLLEGLKFKFPGLKENIYTFNIKESINNPIPEPLSLQHEMISTILSDAVSFSDSQPIPLVRLKDANSVSGIWSLWHLQARNNFETTNLFHSVFISDQGEQYLSYSKEIWNKLIQDDNYFDCVGTMNTESSKASYLELKIRVEELLSSKYAEIEDRMETNTIRIKQNKEKSFVFQEKQMQKIGIENIRQSRLQKLYKEKEQWEQTFDSAKRIVPDLKCLLITKIINE
ncbi:MAG: ATP-dependent helicase [Bacteroidetes bacterium]|nr:ATP-dependent helicase [Bacteroidota bacterium]